MTKQELERLRRQQELQKMGAETADTGRAAQDRMTTGTKTVTDTPDWLVQELMPAQQSGKTPDWMQQQEIMPARPQESQTPAAVGVQAIGREQVLEFDRILQEYKSGKKNLESRIIDNEQWWKLRHSDGMEHTTAADADKSAWLANVIMTKHADAMDAYPTCTCLPHEQTDQAEARKLSSIIPVVLRQCGFEKTYSDIWWQKLKSGTGCYQVTWDAGKLGGLGDIAIRRVNLLNLFWEPGIEDIQDSTYVFHVELWDKERLRERYSQVDPKLLDARKETISRFVYDDHVRTDHKALVVDCYYKRRGKLQLCKYVGDTVLYATENDPAMAQRGLYDHGKFPFVLDPLFPIEGSCCGYGYIDYGKSTQHYIDKLTGAIMENALANAVPRWFIRQDGGVKEEEYADFHNHFIHCNGNLGEDSVRQIKAYQLPGIYLSVLDSRINELKETLGNRDASTGGVTASVTSAAGIASLQEAAGKLSRDAEKASYRVFEDVVYLVIDLIRQFYDVARSFRITGADGTDTYVQYDNSGIRPQSQGQDFGVDMGQRVPQFDIEVEAQKENPYTKESYNELAVQLYQMGCFAPEMANQALMMLGMMDFRGKQELERKIQEQNQFLQIVQQAMLVMQQAAPMGAPVDAAPAEGGGQAGAEAVQTGQVTGAQAQNPANHPFAVQAREQSRAASQPR